MTTVSWELMDTDSANVVGFYPTKDEALAVVRDAFQRFGPAGIDDLALSEQTVHGTGKLLAEGSELLRLATETSLARFAR